MVIQFNQLRELKFGINRLDLKVEAFFQAWSACFLVCLQHLACRFRLYKRRRRRQRTNLASKGIQRRFKLRRHHHRKDEHPPRHPPARCPLLSRRQVLLLVPPQLQLRHIVASYDMYILGKLFKTPKMEPSFEWLILAMVPDWMMYKKKSTRSGLENIIVVKMLHVVLARTIVEQLELIFVFL